MAQIGASEPVKVVATGAGGDRGGRGVGYVASRTLNEGSNSRSEVAPGRRVDWV